MSLITETRIRLVSTATYGCSDRTPGIRIRYPISAVDPTDACLNMFPSEMVENMKCVASSDQELTVEERNLLSVAYKNVIGTRRASWRVVSSIEQKEESKGNEAQVSMIKGYRKKIESELAKICEDIFDVLDKHLIPSAASGESKVFYHKM